MKICKKYNPREDTALTPPHTFPPFLFSLVMYTNNMMMNNNKHNRQQTTYIHPNKQTIIYKKTSHCFIMDHPIR